MLSGLETHVVLLSHQTMGSQSQLSTWSPIRSFLKYGYTMPFGLLNLALLEAETGLEFDFGQLVQLLLEVFFEDD